MADKFYLWSRTGKIGRARDVDDRRHVESNISERFAHVRRVEQRFEIKTAPCFKFSVIGSPAPVRGRGEPAEPIAPLASADGESLIAPLGCHEEIAHFIAFSLEQRPLQSCVRTRVFKLSKVARKLHLQRRRAGRETKFLELRYDPAQNRPSLFALLFREWRRWLIICPFNQLARGRDAHAAKNSLGLTDVDLFRRKINVRVKFSQLRPLSLFSLRSLQWERYLSAANVQRVQKRLVMKKCGVINVERNLADEGQSFSAVLVTKDAHVPRDQATKRIEGEVSNGRFDTAPMQFLDHPRAPLSPEAFAREVPAADDGRRNQ